MSEAITRLNAALEGRYRVESELGEGGMATVYLAEDLKHERMVALKVLKPELAAVVGVERFLAEIKTTANLTHPRILPLHDSGEADSFLFYVMPYIEGETLRERIDREKQLPVDEAIGIATAVASALDTAHEQGVIHRDIKPGNILMSRGEPLVADFGIALAVSAGGAGRLTETGLSLGTPYYMSPEQATGDQAVGPASDTFALACVLYEMLVGEPPYPGSTAQAVLGKIIQGLPVSATAIRQSVPANVDAAIRKALEKLPADRFTGAHDFARALADPGFRHGGTEATEVGAGVGPWNRVSVVLASLLVAASALAAWGWLRPTPEPGVPTRAAVTDVGITGFAGGLLLAISPDGRSILKVADGSIHIRASDLMEWRQLPNTEEGSNPSFSPDGQSIAFGVGGGIAKVAINGGPALPVATSGSRPHWGFDGTIVYEDGDILYRVASSGGDPVVLLDSESVDVARPHLLPNGKAVVFGTGGRFEDSQIFIFEIETGDVRQLVDSGTQPRYVPTGHLVYAHADGALMGVPFDLARLEVTGQQVTVLPSLMVFGGGAAQYGVSDNGTLIYASRAEGPSMPNGQGPLLWVDLEGNETPLPLRVAEPNAPRLSPDGSRIAYESEGQIWLYDTETDTNTQLTFEGLSVGPTWSPDGLFVYFMSERSGTDGRDLFRRAASGASPAEQLWRRDGGEVRLTSISADGSWVVVHENNPATNSDISLAFLGPDSISFREYLREGWNESEGSISPNGKWMAHVSTELDQPEVYVRGFPEPVGRWKISEGLAFDLVWAPSGSTLYFVSERNLMKVDVSTDGTFSHRQPTVLMPWLYHSGGPGVAGHDIHPDGDRFLVVRGSGGGGFGDTYIVVNWFEELKARMGGN